MRAVQSLPCSGMIWVFWTGRCCWTGPAMCATALPAPRQVFVASSFFLSFYRLTIYISWVVGICQGVCTRGSNHKSQYIWMRFRMHRQHMHIHQEFTVIRFLDSVCEMLMQQFSPACSHCECAPESSVGDVFISSLWLLM